MANILVRDVPEPVHARLVERAAAQGMSLQRYLVQALEQVAGRITVADAVAEWEALAQARGPRVDTVWPTDDIALSREARAHDLDKALDADRG